MRKIVYTVIFSFFCFFQPEAANATSVTFITIDPTSSSINRWDGSGYNAYGVEGTIKVTIDIYSYINFNFDNVTTIPDSGFLGSPFTPEVFYDGLNFDNRGQYTCTGACPPVVYDELWGTFDGTSLSFQGSGEAYNYQFSINGTAVSAVPIPAAGFLFFSGLIVLIGSARKRI